MLLDMVSAHAGGFTQFMLAGKTGWTGFGDGLKGFFNDGLGGPGAKGIGIAIMVIGIVAAVISFAMHHFNPQTRMPGWVTCLVIGIAGAVLVCGMKVPLGWFELSAQWVESLLGI